MNIWGIWLQNEVNLTPKESENVRYMSVLLSYLYLIDTQHPIKLFFYGFVHFVQIFFAVLTSSDVDFVQ